MNLVLVKMFATALALAQVTTRPDAVKTHFDPVYDRQEVVDLLRDGCAHMRRAFDLEDINLDDLIDTALKDPAVTSGEIKTFRGINFNDLQLAYREFCKGEQADKSPFDMGEVIQFYNKTVTDLPDPLKLKGLKLPGTTEILDNKGNHFAELFESDHRRIWVSLNEIPDYVQKAFIAAEDKRFFQHHGIDERGLIRAFVSNMADPGRPQGGSTITQQVAKNLLVGDEVSYERKIREMIVAVRLDRSLSKNEILEIYINSIYLGRGAWGIDMAAQAYFNKPVSALSVAEGAFLAGLAKGPASFNPDRFPARARARLAYVLKRMKEDNLLNDAQFTKAMSSPPRVVLYQKPNRRSGFYFVDHLVHEARTLVGMQSLTVNSYSVHSTINQKLQWAVESALQEGLARYEIEAGRTHFEGPEMNLMQSILHIDAEQKTRALRRDRIERPLWQIALQDAKLPLYDVHWTPAVVIDKTGEGRGRLHVGLPDGRILPLVSPKDSDRAKLQQYDVVYVKEIEGRRGEDASAELRVRPTVQGGAIVLENKTGRVLAMAGGFSYPMSQLNRTTQAERQPGSAIKPVTYVTALHKGLQPNTLVLDAPVTLPPIGDTGTSVSRKYWSPHNYGGGYRGVMTLRHALEQSRNLVTARLLKGGIDQDPRQSLFDVCDMAEAAHLYPECLRLYPFVLGAQPIRMINLAAFYAAIASEGAWHEPYVIDSIEQKDHVVYRHPATEPTWLADGDRVAFFQLRTMLEGVVARGTAQSLSRFTGYVGGKTGTSEDENDAWFAAFTSDITVVVWVGYDNLNGRRTLGAGNTGGHVAAPIAGDIIEASWQYQAPKELLPPPSPEAQNNLKTVEVDGITDYLRTNDTGQVADARYAVIGRNRASDYESRGSGERSSRAEDSQPSAGPGFFFFQPQGAWRGYNGYRYGSGGYYNPNSMLHKED
ncbi:MAG TPA: transglycosylase domain-containing protein [Xanthobacteraceae bacterium]|nr:transglycosylase domain-containing protein [Xanthobacteraceae bacterium]